MPTPCPWSWHDPHVLSNACPFPQVVVFISPRTVGLVNET